MQKFLNIQTFLIFGISLLLGLSSCEKEEAAISTDTAGLHLTLEHYFGDAPLEYNKIYYDSMGRAFTFSNCKFYVSNIRLIRKDSGEVRLDNILLLDPEGQTVIKLDTIEPGDYLGLRFDIGLGPLLNDTQPGLLPNDHPLSSSNGMYYGLGNRGYIFLRMEGMVDTSASMSGTADYNWEYWIGTDPLLRTVNLMQQFEAKDAIDVNFNVVCDYEQLFNGINLRFKTHTNSISNMFTAVKVAENMRHAFHLKSAN